MRDVGRETSRNLVEIRTVLSRAETALRSGLSPMRYEGHWGYHQGRSLGPDGEIIDNGYRCRDGDACPDAGRGGFHTTYEEVDPDYEEAKAALEALILALGKFRRTGRPKKAS